jgi:hypothetical protein
VLLGFSGARAIRRPSPLIDGILTACSGRRAMCPPPITPLCLFSSCVGGWLRWPSTSFGPVSLGSSTMVAAARACSLMHIVPYSDLPIGSRLWSCCVPVFSSGRPCRQSLPCIPFLRDRQPLWRLLPPSRLCYVAMDGVSFCRRFDPGGSLDRRVNCRRVPQPRWVGARWSAKGGRSRRETGVKGETRDLRVCPAPRSGALAVGGYKRPRGREREACASVVPSFPARPTLCKRALDLPFIGVRR